MMGAPLRAFVPLYEVALPKITNSLPASGRPVTTSMLHLEQSSIGACTDEHQRHFRRLYSFRVADGHLDRVDLPFRLDCRASRTQLQNLGVDRRDFDRAS